jgi:hypothetical protein
MRSRHAESVPGRRLPGTVRQGSHLASLVGPGTQIAKAPGDASHRSQVLKRTKEIQMSIMHRSRTATTALGAVLIFALAAPITVTAEDQVVVEEHVLAAENQDAALALAVRSWDETSGYGSVEASRATASTLFALVAAPSWDETSGYGSVEASRAAASELLAPSASPSWDDMSGYDSVEASRAAASAMLSGELISGQAQSLALAAATAKSWDETSGYASVEASRAAISDLLAPGKDAVDGVLADC